MIRLPDLPELRGVLGPMDTDAFRELLSHWAATVSVAAVRNDGRIYGTTVTSFTPVDVDPPLVLISLGPNAQIRPFLDADARFTVNLLHQEQARLAEVFADPLPVGPSPFPPEGDPVIRDALAWVTCRVVRLVEVEGGALLVVGRVMEGSLDPRRRPLLWHRRGTARLAPGD